MDDFKRDDPNVVSPIGTTQRRTSETIIVHKESNTAVWWVVGILAAAVVIGLFYFLAQPTDRTSEADLRVAQAEAAAESARQSADSAILQNQINGSRDSVAIANAETATARADAIRATAEARTAEARAATPVVVERQSVEPTPPNGPAVVTSTTPQPGN